MFLILFPGQMDCRQCETFSHADLSVHFSQNLSKDVLKYWMNSGQRVILYDGDITNCLDNDSWSSVNKQESWLCETVKLLSCLERDFFKWKNGMNLGNCYLGNSWNIFFYLLTVLYNGGVDFFMTTIVEHNKLNWQNECNFLSFKKILPPTLASFLCRTIANS